MEFGKQKTQKILLVMIPLIDLTLPKTLNNQIKKESRRI